MCFVKRVQEVRCCFYIGHDGERIVNISLIEKGSLPTRSRFSSMWDMKKLASKGLRGDHAISLFTTPSVCSYRAQLSWNSCPLVATLRRSTRSVLVRFKLYVTLNQLFVKALFVRSCIVSSKGMLVSREDTSYETKMSPFAISKLRISFANSKISVTVKRFKDRGFSLASSHFAKA